MTKFTQLTDSLKYPPKYRATLLSYHSDIIDFAASHFKNVASFKRRIVQLLNSISYYVISGEYIEKWDTADPFNSIQMIDPAVYERVIGNVIVEMSDIIWNLEEVDTDNNNQTPDAAKHPTHTRTPIQSVFEKPTPKEALYLRSPTIPQFDISKPWLNTIYNGQQYTIYQTLPIVPTTQNEVSVTTDINLMTPKDFQKLFPNRIIQTRATAMYTEIPGLRYDKNLGVIISVDGFTEDEMVDCVVKYPHLYKLMRMVKGNLISFYSNIEIDGILYNTAEIWEDLPDSKYFPKTSEFMKEYVIRRYLLERDIRKIQHKYPLFGDLSPFLTLFMPPSEYAEYGCKDSNCIARQCVAARVSYLQSRNPVLRMVMGNP